MKSSGGMLWDLVASSLLPLQPVWAHFSEGEGDEMGSKHGGVGVCLSGSIFSVPNISTLLFLGFWAGSGHGFVHRSSPEWAAQAP